MWNIAICDDEILCIDDIVKHIDFFSRENNVEMQKSIFTSGEELVASGSNKAQAIKNLMEGPITEDFPASALNNHKGKVIVVADEEACALLSK